MWRATKGSIKLRIKGFYWSERVCRRMTVTFSPTVWAFSFAVSVHVRSHVTDSIRVKTRLICTKYRFRPTQCFIFFRSRSLLSSSMYIHNAILQFKYKTVDSRKTTIIILSYHYDQLRQPQIKRVQERYKLYEPYEPADNTFSTLILLFRTACYNKKYCAFKRIGIFIKIKLLSLNHLINVLVCSISLEQTALLVLLLYIRHTFNLYVYLFAFWYTRLTK